MNTKEPIKLFSFTYYSTGKELMVELEANSLNDAMIVFAKRYHKIDEVFEIVEINNFLP